MIYVHTSTQLKQITSWRNFTIIISKSWRNLKVIKSKLNFTYKIEKDQYISFKFQLGDQQKENLR